MTSPSRLRRPALGSMATALVLGGLLLAVAHPGSSRGAQPVPTAIEVVVPPTSKLGQDAIVRVRVTAAGAPVTSRLVQLLLDGRQLRNGSLDGNGSVAIPIRGKELSFAHKALITVAFHGGADLSASQASREMTVTPAVITVQTVPAVDGIPMTLGTQRVLTQKGIATFQVSRAGSYVLTPDVSAFDQSDMRAGFVRWADNVFTPERPIVVIGDETLILGLQLAYRGSFQFVNSAGNQIPKSSIQSITLTSTGGSEKTLTDFDNVWLDAGTAVKQLDSLTASPRTWRLLEVQMAGTNVVNRGQQRLTPAPRAVWTVELLLYDLQVQARDAIFGNPIGGELSLVYPDGSVRVTQFGKDGSSIEYLQLPRGAYTLRLKVAGLGAPTPVALSRDQTAVIRVITYLDIGILGGLLLLAVGAMAWFGRRDQLIWLGNHIRGRSAAAVGANRGLLGGIADRSSRAYRDRKRDVAAAMGRSLDNLPMGWRGFAHDIGGLGRTLGSDLARLVAASGRWIRAAALWAARATGIAGGPADRPVPSQSPEQPAPEVTNIATFDVSRRLRAHRPRSPSAESGEPPASAANGDSSRALGQVIGRTWERSTPTLTKGPIDRARRRQLKLEAGTRPCANCGYLQSMYARYCNRCGERVERVD
jgi:hypothetical protein